MGAVRTELHLTETSAHHSGDSAICAVPCLAAKGCVLSQPLQLLPHDVLSSPGEEMNMFSVVTFNQLNQVTVKIQTGQTRLRLSVKNLFISIYS